MGIFYARIAEGEAAPGPDGFIVGNGLTDAQNAALQHVFSGNIC
jgi:hypothetical protein